MRLIHNLREQLFVLASICICLMLAGRGHPEEPNAPIPGQDFTEFYRGIQVRMIWMDGGRFLMGSPADEKGRLEGETRHWVELDGFWLGETEVTHAQYGIFVSETGYRTLAEGPQGGGMAYDGVSWRFRRDANWRQPMGAGALDPGPEFPVVQLSWHDAMAFSRWLAKETGSAYTLPTEAQWEYACRAGSTVAYSWGETIEEGYRWQLANDPARSSLAAEWRRRFERREGYVYLLPVRTFRPNAWGLYGMHGSVWEWCADAYEEDYYLRSPGRNPEGPHVGATITYRSPGTAWKGEAKVMRGAPLADGAAYARSAKRNPAADIHRSAHLGFRIARNTNAGEKESGR